MTLEKVAIKNDRQGDMRIGLRIGQPPSTRIGQPPSMRIGQPPAERERDLPVLTDEDQ